MLIKDDRISLFQPYQKTVKFYCLISLFFLVIIIAVKNFSENKFSYYSVPVLLLTLSSFSAIYFAVLKKNKYFFIISKDELILYNANKSLKVPVSIIEAIYVGERNINPKIHFGGDFSPTLGGVHRAYMNSPIIFKIPVDTRLKELIGLYNDKFIMENNIYTGFTYSTPNKSLKSKLIESLSKLLKNTQIISIQEYKSLQNLPKSTIQA